LSTRRLLALSLVVAGVVPLLVLGIAFPSVLGAHVYGDLGDMSRSTLSALAAKAVESLVEGPRRDLPPILALSGSYPGRLQDLLASFGAFRGGEYALLLVLDPAGRIEATYPDDPRVVGRSYRPRSSPADGSVAFSGPFASSLARATVVEAACTEDRRTIVALIESAEVSFELASTPHSPRDRLGIVDGAGRYIACSDPQRALRMERVDPALLAPGPAPKLSPGGEFFASSAEVPGTGWRVLYLRSAEAAEAPISMFIVATALIGLASVGISGLLSLFLWSRVSSPLSSLSGRIDRIADGRYGERIGEGFSGEFREIGLAFDSMAESIERRDREILESEERYRTLFAKSIVPTLVIDPSDGALCDANEAAVRYYGYPREELLAFTAMDIDGTPPGELKSLGAAASSGERTCFLTRHRLAGGAERDVELYASPVVIGGAERLYCTVFDVTQRRIAEDKMAAALEERTLLLREVYHRVKNNLQIISSLLSLQAQSCADEATADAFRLAQDRVYAMSVAHELVYQMGDLASIEIAQYTRKVVSNLRMAWGVAEGSLSLSLSPLSLELEWAIPYGLALNELVSNAFKYASPSPATPVRISLESGGGSAVLAVEDSGPGVPRELMERGEKKGSLGMMLISALARQLGGAASWSPGEGGSGTRAAISFPLGEGARG